MSTRIDLRNQSIENHRERLFDALDEVDSEDALKIVAARDIDPDLVHYQIRHNQSLDWKYEDPDAEPREVCVTVGDALDDDLAMIDVRDLKPQRRHEALKEIFDELGAGEGFTLVNDHDPKPLYHELRSMYGDVVEWEYASRGSDAWRVDVVKTEQSEVAAEDVAAQYDVRDIPKSERHPTIHHRYGMIPDGRTMELIAPHEPRPLRQEFNQRYGDSFTWTVVESEPGRCRVRITKDEHGDERGDESNADGEEGGVASQGDAEEPEIVAELDVRDLPPAQRHEQIFDAYADLDTGDAFVLVNDHDPKPLYHQFEAETGDEFHWEYRQRDAGEFRVSIGKRATTASDASEAGRPDAPF